MSASEGLHRGGGGFASRGVCIGRVLPGGGVRCLHTDMGCGSASGAFARGGSASRGGSAQAGLHLGRSAAPSVNRMTHRCKNITLPQTSFAGGNNDFRTLMMNIRPLISLCTRLKFTL